MGQFIGNKPIFLLLDQSVRRDTVPHAYIFTGPEGVGKKFLALNLAKSLNCLRSRDGLESCGECPSCRKIDVGGHPDVQVIYPETKVFKVDQIRLLIQDIYFQPFEGRRRVFILEEADRMNEEAANSLLKTLEEPPEKSVLILLTTNLYALLPTVRSRSQVLKFLPIPAGEIEEFLRESRAMAPPQAALAARMSQGSLSAALSLDMSAFAKVRDSAFLLLQTMIGGDDALLAEQVTTIIDPKKVDFELFINIFISILRDLVIMEHFREREQLLHYDFLETLVELRRAFPPPVVDQILHDIEDIYRKRHLNIRIELFFHNLVLKYASATARRTKS